MYETESEIAELQAMFDAHLARANPHMRNIVTPDRRPHGAPGRQVPPGDEARGVRRR
jgi:hypothetical protein